MNSYKSIFFLPVMLLTLLFLTISCGDDENKPPSKPSNNVQAGSPPHPSNSQSITPTLSWTCSDPDGDALLFDIYFGSNNPPSRVKKNYSGNHYSPDSLSYNTKYFWKIVAHDNHGHSASSPDWYFTTRSCVETVSKPNTLSGPSGRDCGESGNYAASGAYSSCGHSLQYKLDWGDGSQPIWGSATRSHSWSSAGSFCIKARARCANHTSKVSDWSNCKTVTISCPETISKPNTPSGLSSRDCGESGSYSAGGASSNLGHSLQYRFDWGDGSYSSWSSSTSASHSWSSSGTKYVKVQARCATHTSVVSSWSNSTTVTISCPETISKPSPPSGPSNGSCGTTYQFTGSASSNRGHSLV